MRKCECKLEYGKIYPTISGLSGPVYYQQKAKTQKPAIASSTLERVTSTLLPEKSPTSKPEGRSSIRNFAMYR
ncbi:hypothetical protein MAR_035767 [Mya arenaria]|uniref:Uncharacterized protein n=1 Tax=Mya arenaria TaxID=6604 RepID=A0ABY7EU30_MYAAR|nr:hypothetical protein MAR_035767 [Mya arenaria]